MAGDPGGHAVLDLIVALLPAIAGLRRRDHLLHHRSSEEHLPDVILLDIYMPEMDGWAFLKVFADTQAQFAKPIDIFIISSSDHLKDINKARSIPHVKAYLQKPVTMEVLKNLVAVPERNE